MMSLWHWLSLPLSGTSTHFLEPGIYWHARLMVLAWGVMLPLGALTARYFKVLRTQKWPATLDNTWWWHTHRALQWGGMGLATLGLYLVWRHQAGFATPAHLHTVAGWALMALGWVQILGGLLRGSKGGPTAEVLRGDHYDMTPHRIWFERLHKALGWLSVLLSVAVLLAGLALADAPRWMPVLLCLWWASLAALTWRWQTQGRCIDTYQAIWGPDTRHPGNQLPPIGWGIRRPLDTQKNGQS